MVHAVRFGSAPATPHLHVASTLTEHPFHRRAATINIGHLPFQVLDASAIEGIRGLAGESSSIYSCIQIYKALTPPAPPSVSQRNGRTWASILCGILRGATLPRSRAVRSPIRANPQQSTWGGGGFRNSQRAQWQNGLKPFCDLAIAGMVQQRSTPTGLTLWSRPAPERREAGGGSQDRSNEATGRWNSGLGAHRGGHERLEGTWGRPLAVEWTVALGGGRL